MSNDVEMVQAGFYVDKRVKKALRIAAFEREVTQTALATEILARVLKVNLNNSEELRQQRADTRERALDSNSIEHSNLDFSNPLDEEESEEVKTPEPLTERYVVAILQNMEKGIGWEATQGGLEFRETKCYTEQIQKACEERGITFIP